MINEDSLREVRDQLAELAKSGGNGLSLFDIGLSDPETALAAIREITPYLGQLQSLSLRNTQISDVGLEALAARAEHLGQLQSLNLSNTEISDVGLEALAARAEHLGQLQSLDLRNTQISDVGLEALAEHLGQLQSLYLSNTQISDVGLEALAEHLGQLQSLYLWNTKISDVGLEALAEHLGQLQSLYLWNTKISDVGLEALAARAEHLGQLQSLDLDGTKISDVGLEALAARAEHLGQLQSLDLRNTKVTLPEELSDGGDAHTIFEFVRTRERPLLEIKLLLVGEGRVGKTHLRKRLFEEDEEDADVEFFDRDLESTHDVDTLLVTAPTNSPKGEENTPVRMRVWDFGGQRRLHGTHRFFLGAVRSMYVLVLDVTRPPNGEGPRSNRLNYWLRMLAHHGNGPRGRSPVIVVQTQCDRVDLAEARQEPDSDASQYRDELETALHFAEKQDWFGANVVARIDGFGLSDKVQTLPSKNQKRIKGRHYEAADAICQAIATHLPKVVGLDDKFPSAMFELHADLRKRFDPQASIGSPHFNYHEDERFLEIFNRNQVSDALQKMLLFILHNLGILHWVGHVEEIDRGTNAEMKSFVFNPHWVKRPVYHLIRVRDPDDTTGWLSHEVLSRYLPAPMLADPNAKELYRRLHFSTADRDNVKELMRTCRLAFDIKDERGLRDGLLIPDLLRSRAPRQLVVWNDDNVCRESWRLPFIPERLFLRFVAKHYLRVERSNEERFRNEVQLCWPVGRNRGDCEALIHPVISPPGAEFPRLEIAVRGQDDAARRRVLDGILDSLDELAIAEGLIKPEGREGDDFPPPPDIPIEWDIKKAREAKTVEELERTVPPLDKENGEWVSEVDVPKKVSYKLQQKSLSSARSRAPVRTSDLSIGLDNTERIWRKDPSGKDTWYWIISLTKQGTKR